MAKSILQHCNKGHKRNSSSRRRKRLENKHGSIYIVQTKRHRKENKSSEDETCWQHVAMVFQKFLFVSFFTIYCSTGN